MEVASLLVGIPPIVAKAAQVWKIFSDSQHFGDDLVAVVAKLSFEYSLFRCWCRTAGLDSISSVEDHSQYVPYPNLLAEESNPIYQVIARIVATLQEAERITQKYRVAESYAASEAPPSVATAALSTLTAARVNVNDKVSLATQKQRDSKHWLSKNVPFLKRVMFSTKPWSVSDKEALEACASEFSHWNQSLYRWTTLETRNSIQMQAMPAQAIDQSMEESSAEAPLEENSLETLKDMDAPQQEGLRKGIAMYEFVRGVPQQELKALEILSTDIERRSQTRSSLYLATISSLSPLSQVAAPRKLNKVQGIVESYSASHWSDAEQRIAAERLNELANIFQFEGKPPGLHVLSTIGFHCDREKGAFGLIYQLPDGYNDAVAAATLSSLLGPQKLGSNYRPAATLEEKVRLARRLTGSLLSLHMVGWLHKNFGSHSVLCYADDPSGRLKYGNAVICGFGISRPANPEGLSLNMDPEVSDLDLYRHPDLRASPKNPPRFQRRYDIYSLGVALFEIGIWDRVKRFSVRGTEQISPVDFRDRLLKYAGIELPPRMGCRYAEVVKKCLAASDVEGDISNSLEDFYWGVVADIEKCQCQF